MSFETIHRTPILGAEMAHREMGAGRPIVCLHGNPTSSYVWRHVVPGLAEDGRALAPDLIGMGASAKPEIAYRFADHARYLDAWFDALELRDVTLVGYDWGGVLALDWARRHPSRVRGVAVFETFLRPMSWEDWPPAGAELFRALRTPGVGEKMVLEENQFLARSLDNGVKGGLAAVDRERYYAPYPTPASRRPLLAWPREIPIDGEPADVVEVVKRNAEWLETATMPKLLLTFSGAPLSGMRGVVEWARGAGVHVEELGAAGHHAPEDAHEAIVRALRAWMASSSR